MKIFLSNDDGINSLGIKGLADKLSISNEVLVVAPDSNRSAAAHSLSIGKKLKLTIDNDYKKCRAYSLTGTPADCVKFSKLVFPEFKTDVVVSGINNGHNLGSDILYSGTVSIACEGAFFGNIAFAFSAYEINEKNSNTFSDYAVKIIDLLLPYSSSGDIWNINFPDNSKNEIKGIKITPLGLQIYTDRYKRTDDGEYILVGELVDHDKNYPDCDVEWIKKGYITITPILFDKTNKEKIKIVKRKCEKLL